MEVFGGVNDDGLRYLSTGSGATLVENEVPEGQFEQLWKSRNDPRIADAVDEIADENQWSMGEIGAAGAAGLGAAALMPFGIGKATRAGLGAAGRFGAGAAQRIGGEMGDIARGAGAKIDEYARAGAGKVADYAERGATRAGIAADDAFAAGGGGMSGAQGLESALGGLGARARDFEKTGFAGLMPSRGPAPAFDAAKRGARMNGQQLAQELKAAGATPDVVRAAATGRLPPEEAAKILDGLRTAA